MKRLFLSAIILIFSCISSTYTNNYLHQVCSTLFGKKEASNDIQAYFSQAKNNFKVSNSTPIPIKYIKKNRFLNQFCAFTWFGTWVDKNYWNSISDMQKQWAAHHEVAHTVLSHPKKQIGIACSTAIITYLITKALKPLSPLAVTLSLATIVPYYSCLCEKYADITAAKILCEKGKIEVVEAHIKDLKSHTHDSSIWFYDTKEQVNYLEQIIKECNDTQK